MFLFVNQFFKNQTIVRPFLRTSGFNKTEWPIKPDDADVSRIRSKARQLFYCAREE